MSHLSRLRLATAVLLLFVLAPLSTGHAAKTLTCNVVYPRANFHAQGAIDFAEKIKGYTQGSVTITVSTDGRLGYASTELLGAVSRGVLDLSDILMGSALASERVFGVSSLPLLASSYEEARRLYKLFKPLYEDACGKWGVVFLYAAPWPPSGLFSNTPVSRLDDFKGLRIRTYDTSGAGLFARCGATPLTVQWNELANVLRSGMVNSVLTSSVSGKEASLQDSFSHFLALNYAYPLNMLVMRSELWAKLSLEEKTAFRRAATEIEKAQWERSQAEDEKAMRYLTDKGVTVSRPSEALMEELAPMVQAVQNEFSWRASHRARQMLSDYMISR